MRYHRQETIDYYDRVAAHYQETAYGTDATPNAVRLSLVLEWVRSLPKGRVLDAGCGTGVLLRALLEKGFEGAGCDLSPGMVAQARRQLADAGYSAPVHATSLDNLTLFEDQSFDYVFCLGVLPYIPPGQEEVAYAEIRRVLKPGGKLISTHNNELFDAFTFNRYTVAFWSQHLGALMQEVGVAADSLDSSLASLLTQPLAPQQHDLKRSGRSAIFLKSENPLIFREKLQKLGFDEEDVLYYHFHAVPPLLLGQDARWREASHQMEGRMARCWQGMFLASSFISVATLRS